MRHPLLDLGQRPVLGHRGNCAHAPENTLESFRQAITLGVDALEFDVR
ncbi:MAG: glycerophosphodiester phosphodiesterase family protein, partial [Gemmatimonadaceae bacterium]